ncbi:MAG: hypothetical protein ACHP7N_08505 [Caulobacterales bacterium]
MKAEQTLPFLTEDTVGGLIRVSCGFSTPGDGALPDENLADVLERGCARKRYLASFSNGRHLVNVWVDQDIIVRIDYYPRHVIDL